MSKEREVEAKTVEKKKIDVAKGRDGLSEPE